MLRIRLTLPPPLAAKPYTHQDLIHDAIINGIESAGYPASNLIGSHAQIWNFAPLGWHRGHVGFVQGLVISTTDPELARALTRLKPEHIAQRRWNDESINFAGAELHVEPDPLFPQQTQLACLLLSPLALQQTQHGTAKHWCKDLRDLDLSEIISRKLSAKAGRPIQLTIKPDALYLRANPEHSVLVNLKQLRQGQKSFVIGMQAPLLLEGSEEDLRFAWYAGIGEKTRNGFGCLGLLEQGLQG
ncbi:CRISPR-associated endoribonuclease Cas6 [Thiofilum flexile]|uniref:CRISPR-associated endoribonuclease Cas6 n=1 Tax=Thiofilum flexile TaxID=125627 RepID=UPI000362D962|nr:CRISPR-associated endoribonuclease Cas6 [Thiofilum flexile]